MRYYCKKKNINFFDILKDQTGLTLEGVKALCEYCNKQTDEKAEMVKKFEVQADTSHRLLISEMNTTMFTPIDRKALFDLSCTVDDIADYAETTVEELRIYGLEADAHIKKMANVILQHVTGIFNAVTNLEHNRDTSSNEIMKVKELKNTVDQYYCTSMSEVFENESIENILKLREIYHHLKNAADKGDHAVDILINIIVSPCQIERKDLTHLFDIGF